MLGAWFFTALSSVLNSWGFSQVAKLVKSLPANAGDTRDMGSIPRSGRSPGVEMTTHSGILAQEIPWTEKLQKSQT